MKNLSGISQISFCIFALLLFQNCAPVFSDLQSARTVGKDNFEFTPSMSSVSIAHDKEREGFTNHIGLQAAYGISAKTDLRVRYERLWPKGEGIRNGVSVIGLGPKFSLWENKMAFYLPLGRAFGEDTRDTWQIHPTLLFTLPVLEDQVDVTFSPKYLLTFCEDCEDYLAFNLGTSFSTNLNKWAIRPEGGILLNLNDSDFSLSHFSIGVSVTLDKNIFKK